MSLPSPCRPASCRPSCAYPWISGRRGSGRGAGEAVDGDDGMATAELAVAMFAVMLVLAVALGALRAAVDELRCVDAARAAARVAARGEPIAAVRSVAARASPRGSTVQVSLGPSLVSVAVTGPPLRLAFLLSLGLRPSARATAVPETDKALGGGG